MKAGFLKLAVFVLALNLFFLYIGLYFLPQSESRPPKATKIEGTISPEQLIQTGEKIVFGKGECMVCHPMNPEAGMRAPAIASIGMELEKEAKQEGITSQERVFEALVNPTKLVLKGFEPIMSPVNEPPSSLNESEIIAVAAYLQSKGGKVTVSLVDSLPVVRKEIQKAGGK